MSNTYISQELISPSVNDKRNRALISAASSELDRRKLSDLKTIDALTVDKKLLPAMIVARAMTDFMYPGMREEDVRNLLHNAREIHAKSGFIAGTRLALRSIGIEVSWTQWWQQSPMGHHNTHIVDINLSDQLFSGQDDLLDPRAFDLIRKFVDLTKRFTQDIAIRFLASGDASSFVGVSVRVFEEINVPALFVPPLPASATQYSGIGITSYETIEVPA